MTNKPTFIDLFAGAGGLSEGFAKNGFIPVAHIEMDQDSCDTLRTRAIYRYLKAKKKIRIYHDYLLNKITREEFYSSVPINTQELIFCKEMSTNNLQEIFKDIHLKLKERGTREVTAIVGGPPCQAYSTAARPKVKIDDSRKYLYKLYGRFLKEFNPKIFIFENVPGILTSDKGRHYKNLQKYFRRVGYDLEGRVLNAANFGVVQNRERVILIGWKREMKNFQYPEFKFRKNHWTVEEVLEDLPNLQPGDSPRFIAYKKEPNNYLKSTGIRGEFHSVTHHITRPHNKKDLKIYEMAIDQWQQYGKRLKNHDIPEQHRTQKNIESFLDRFKVVKNDSLSHTIIAHIAKDGHYYIHPSRNQLRSLSVREAARIQSFPDDYFFEGSRTSAFRQIGNAVPPLMSQKIAKTLKKLLTQNV